MGSRNKEQHWINQRVLFDENYAVALMQSLKNKDIPEGGSKGAILPSCVSHPTLSPLPCIITNHILARLDWVQASAYASRNTSLPSSTSSSLAKPPGLKIPSSTYTRSLSCSSSVSMRVPRVGSTGLPYLPAPAAPPPGGSPQLARARLSSVVSCTTSRHDVLSVRQ